MTSRVPGSEWEMLVSHRVYLLHLGRAMFFLAFLSILPGIWGKPITMPAGVTFVVFAMWVFNARGLTQRIADQQAALDMKRIVKDARRTTGRANFVAGDTLAVDGAHRITFLSATSVDIEIRK